MINIIFNLDSFKEYLHNLSDIELLALLNIFGLISIFLANSTWITICVGDFFISKFDLENKFPFLKNLILFRKTINKYYIIFQVTLASFAWCLLMFVDVKTFTGSW